MDAQCSLSQQLYSFTGRIRSIFKPSSIFWIPINNPTNQVTWFGNKCAHSSRRTPVLNRHRHGNSQTAHRKTLLRLTGPCEVISLPPQLWFKLTHWHPVICMKATVTQLQLQDQTTIFSLLLRPRENSRSRNHRFLFRNISTSSPLLLFLFHSPFLCKEITQQVENKEQLWQTHCNEQNYKSTVSLLG